MSKKKSNTDELANEAEVVSTATGMQSVGDFLVGAKQAADRSLADHFDEQKVSRARQSKASEGTDPPVLAKGVVVRLENPYRGELAQLTAMVSRFRVHSASEALNDELTNTLTKLESALEWMERGVSRMERGA